MRIKIGLNIYFEFSLIIIFLLTSCLTLKENYISSSNPSSDANFISKPVSNAERKLLNHQADSIMKKLSERKGAELHIKAEDLNKLYTIFSRQIEYDRYYNSILLKGASDNDSITSEQCLASIYLLNSAAYYDKTYYANKKVRRALNRGNYSNNIPKNTLQKSNEFLYSPEIRKSISPCLEKKISPEFDSIYNSLPSTDYLHASKNWFNRGNESVSSFVYDATGASSYAFGNTVGAFNQKVDQVRRAEMIAPYLKPYDIIISKSPHHLTDKFIPGYFGHSAICFGEDISKPKYDNNNRIIRTGKHGVFNKTLVEALRQGVKVSSLEEFADGDVYLIIRIKNLSNAQKFSMIFNARQQISKPYDFNFDIESSEAITCTELVFLACDFIDWKVRYTFGRFTLSPDDLLSTAIENDNLEVPILISGDKVIENPGTEILKSLLSQD